NQQKSEFNTPSKQVVRVEAVVNVIMVLVWSHCFVNDVSLKATKSESGVHMLNANLNLCHSQMAGLFGSHEIFSSKYY
ncbi:MAG: hypothetical protein QOH33_2260, partial [Paraburkholderia sp.]|nr:hypothetical protein [Paraburkholderia sp.]